MIDAIRLHWFWSTNPQKSRLALEELGLDYTLETVDLIQGAHKASDYRAINPRQRVPALEIDGTVLWESGAILAYLGQREGRLWPDTAQELASALNLLFFESSVFQDCAGTHFFNRAILPFLGKEGDATRVADADSKIAPLLGLLSDTLGDGDYLLGDFTLVDCAFAPWLPWIDLDAFPRLDAWLERLMARPSWTACNVADPNNRP